MIQEDRKNKDKSHFTVLEIDNQYLMNFLDPFMTIVKEWRADETLCDQLSWHKRHS